MKDADKAVKRKQNMISIAVIVLAAAAVMFSYITGESTYLFSDAGGDSFNQTYPNYLYLARCIEAGLTQGTYNFSQGIGTAQGAITFSLSNWFCWFGTEHVAYLMGINQFFKIILAGLFFYGFLRVKGCEWWYSTALALGYAFCGHMVIRAAWMSYPGEVVLVAMWLLAFELWFQRKDLRWVIIATVVFAQFRSSTYNRLLYGALLVVYVLFRYLTERRIYIKAALLAAAAAVVGGIGYLSYTNMAILQTVKSILSSERASNQIAVTDLSLGAFLPNWSNFPTVFLRTVGLDLLGGGRNYQGAGNLLGAPTFYCGVLVLLLIPLAFRCMSKKQRVCYAIGYAAAFVYCFSDPFRTIVNGFSNDTYKLSSFWIILLLLLTVSNICWRELEQTLRPVSLLLWMGIPAVLLGGTTLLMRKYAYTDIGSLCLTVAFLLLEAVMPFVMFREPKLKKTVQHAMVALVACEVVLCSFSMYNDRETEDGSKYADDTVEALELIAENDTHFYRVDKQYQSVAMCDSLAQNYNGLNSYVGGLGIGDSIIQFYYDMNLVTENDIRLLYAPSNYNELNTLLGVKYILAKGEIANFGYTKIGQSGTVSVYENDYAVPMGFVYHAQISQEDFEKLSYKTRQQVLLKACVGSSDLGLPYLDSSVVSALSENMEQMINDYTTELTYSTDEFKFVMEPNDADEMIALRLHFTDTEGGYAIIHYSTTDGTKNEIQIIDIEKASGQIYEIDEPHVNRIWIDTRATFDLIQAAAIPRDLYYQNYIEDMERIAGEKVELATCTANEMAGTFYSSGSGILYLPIVNGAWQVYLDGEYANAITINDTFMGIYVSEGEHSIRLVYPEQTLMDMYRGKVKTLVFFAVILLLGGIWMRVIRK
jgi:hypothetical protein